jgi:iron only hydrogenase large subunit-like protein
MGTYFHSVTLEEDKCKGCTNCIKRCPTEAIRVRKSKARIINERCIDCGECIRICPYHAKKAISDPFEAIDSFKYKVVIPAPTLYGQFKSAASRNHILTALMELGFDEVFEVAKAAEIITFATRKLVKKNNFKKPLISSACPAVVRLIQVRFPNLIDNIVRLESPMELAAEIVKNKLSLTKNIPPEDVGVFFITPCAAKVTSVKAPYEKERSFVDGVISIKDIYLRL